jgi:aminoglycoside phosphotransferase (APT) family kinase protein
VLRQFGVTSTDFIDAGQQSEVFALGADRVLRVFREPADVDFVARQRTFLAEIDGRLALPTSVIDDFDPGGRWSIERRLAGKSMLRLLPSLTGERRRQAIRNYVAATSAIGRLTFADRPYGHAIANDPIHAETWTAFLRASLERAIATNRDVIAAEVGDLATLRPKALALLALVPERPAKALVHGDYFPGNVLMDEALTVTGLVDFSAYTLVGDPLYDTLTAPIFLEMIDDTTADEVALALECAVAMAGGSVGAGEFYRAHAAFWMADPVYALPPYVNLYPWAIANLRKLAGSA